MESISESLPKSPACKQFDIGGATHYFDEPLESEFREVYLEANMALLRGALLFGLLFGLAVLALEYWLVESGLVNSSVPVRTTITLPFALAMLIASFHHYHEKYHRRTFLEMKSLKDLAGLDALTRLPNRQTLDDYLSKIWLNAKRESKPIALALIDIDHFKAFNDKYGHQAGDRSLISVAQVLGNAMRRPLDFAARFGGEEFIVILTGTTVQDADSIINDLRLQVQALKIPHKTSTTAKMLTVSTDSAHLFPHRTDHSIQGFIQLADQALYQAKNCGRNRVCLSGSQDDIDTKTGLFQLESFKAA